jgi:hypothetical protein
MIGFVILLTVIVLVWMDQARSVYCLQGGRCITVWKRLGNKCYVIANRYSGMFRPIDNYIETTNTEFVTIIWANENRLLIDVDDKAQIVSMCSGENQIERYSNSKVLNDSLYTYLDEGYRKYKKEVDFLNIDIRASYATDRNGRVDKE